MEVGGIKVLRQRLLCGGVRLIEMIQVNVRIDDVGVRQRIRRRDLTSFAIFSKRFVVFSQILVHHSQVVSGDLLARIGLLPQFVNLAGLFQVAGRELMVVRLDIEPLPLTNASA